MTALVNLVVMLGMFVIVPTGLRLTGSREFDRVRRAWPLFAAAGALSLWLPRGAPATVLAAWYAAGTLLLALHAPRRLARTRDVRPAELAVLTALVSPAVAGTALVAERADRSLFSFDPGLLALTVPHFHFAGFAAALVAGLLCADTGDGPAARFAALSVPAGTLLVLVGYFLGDTAELAGAVVLTAGMWTVAALSLRLARARGTDRTARTLLGVAAGTLAASMVLALSWALGEATGLPHPSLTWMAATHGAGNALGFALCALLALRRVRRPAPTDPAVRTESPVRTAPEGTHP
ncbi:YndJ family protein [uncultured Streptomyces sp.]|uniref:YndJ family protein n=1 Tax=uncultured Streptomyces sp. TaxID=174707 RepID=UPI002613F4AB|nr:YndJ family protein [uncultured Streptomyces sp.]